MTNHPHDDIEAFVLGELETPRAQAILVHADACPTCAVLLAEAMNGVAALAQLESPREVMRDAPRRVAVESPVAIAAGSPVAVEFIRPRKTFRAASAWFAGAAAAACLALLFWNIQLRNDALSVPVSSLVHSHFIHHPLTNPKSTAAAKVLQALDGRWLYVVTDGLAPHTRYDVWETRDGRTLIVGVISTDGAGRVTKYFEQTPGSISALAVTETGRSPEQDASALRWP